MRVAIVENTAVTHHGQVGVALHEAAARIDIFKPWRDGILPDLADHDALVVLGGEQSARADTSHPYLPDLAGLMAQTGASGRAVLGICLGAQLLARGLGGQNLLGAAPEFGWCEVRRTGQSEGDPVLGLLPERFAIFQWHADTFTLPPGATRLAGSAATPVQCFRVGRACYGMQFHFEASRVLVADWMQTFPELIARIEPGWASGHAAKAATLGDAADRHGLAIARAWVGQI